MNTARLRRPWSGLIDNQSNISRRAAAVPGHGRTQRKNLNFEVILYISISVHSAPLRDIFFFLDKIKRFCNRVVQREQRNEPIKKSSYQRISHPYESSAPHGVEGQSRNPVNPRDSGPQRLPGGTTAVNFYEIMIGRFLLSDAAFILSL